MKIIFFLWKKKGILEPKKIMEIEDTIHVFPQLNDLKNNQIERFGKSKNNCDNQDDECTYGKRITYHQLDEKEITFSTLIDYIDFNIIKNGGYSICLIVFHISVFEKMFGFHLPHCTVISISPSTSNPINIKIIYHGFPFNDEHIIDCNEEKKIIQQMKEKFEDIQPTFEILIYIESNAQHNLPLENKKILDAPLTFLGFIQNSTTSDYINQYLEDLSKEKNNKIKIHLVTSEMNRSQHTALQICQYLYINKEFILNSKNNKNLYFLGFLFDKMAIQSLAKFMTYADNISIAQQCEETKCYKDKSSKLFEDIIKKIFTEPQIKWINQKIQNCHESYYELSPISYNRIYNLVRNMDGINYKTNDKREEYDYILDDDEEEQDNDNDNINDDDVLNDDEEEDDEEFFDFQD